MEEDGGGWRRKEGWWQWVKRERKREQLGWMDGAFYTYCCQGD